MKVPRAFWLLFSLTFFNQSVPCAFFVLPSLLFQWNFSAAQIGLLMSAFYFGATLSRSLGGWLVERWGVKRAVIASGVFGALMGFLFLFRNFTVLLISRVIVGSAFGVLSVACVAYQGMAVAPAERGRVFAFLGLAYIFPQFLIVPFSELLIDGGWTGAFMLLSSVSFLFTSFAALPLPRVLKTGAEVQKTGRAWGTWRELLSRRDTWSLIVTTLALFSINAAAVQYVPTLIRTLGLKGALFTSTFTCVTILLRSVGGTVLTRYDRRTLVCACAMLEGVGLWLIPQNAEVTGLVLSSAIYGVGNAFAFSGINALIPDVIPPRLIPKGSAAYLFAYDAAFIVIPLVISAASASLGLPLVLECIAGCSLAVFPVIYFFLWRRPPLKAQ